MITFDNDEAIEVAERRALERREEAIKAAYNGCEGTVKSTRQSYADLARLQELWPELELRMYSRATAVVTLQRGQLQTARARLGSLTTRWSDLASAERKTEWVYLRCSQIPSLLLKYERPIREGCRVVSEHKPPTYKLVCEVKR